MYSLILEGEGGPTEDRENSLIFFFFLLNPSLSKIRIFWKNIQCTVFIYFAIREGFKKHITNSY